MPEPRTETRKPRPTPSDEKPSEYQQPPPVPSAAIDVQPLPESVDTCCEQVSLDQPLAIEVAFPWRPAVDLEESWRLLLSILMLQRISVPLVVLLERSHHLARRGDLYGLEDDQFMALYNHCEQPEFRSRVASLSNRVLPQALLVRLDQALDAQLHRPRAQAVLTEVLVTFESGLDTFVRAEARALSTVHVAALTTVAQVGEFWEAVLLLDADAGRALMKTTTAFQQKIEDLSELMEIEVIAFGTGGFSAV